MESVAREVIGTHYGWHGDRREAFLKEHLPGLWAHYDVLNEGFLDSARGPPLLRQLLGEVETSEGLQLQMDEDNMPQALGQGQFRPNPIQQPWSLNSKDKRIPSKIDNGFTTHSHKAIVYERHLPGMFTEAGDDQLMKSLLSKYAIEGNTSGTPNGHFYITKGSAAEVSGEVANTHLGLKGAAE